MEKIKIALNSQYCRLKNVPLATSNFLKSSKMNHPNRYTNTWFKNCTRYENLEFIRDFEIFNNLEIFKIIAKDISVERGCYKNF